MSDLQQFVRKEVDHQRRELMNKPASPSHLAFGITVALTLMGVAARPALSQNRYGTLAIDRMNGTAYGWAVGYAARADADSRATRECSRVAGTACQVVLRFTNGCGAYALDREQGSTLYGWATAPNRASAEARALEEARRRGARGPYVRVWGCTNTPTPTVTTNATPRISPSPADVADDARLQQEADSIVARGRQRRHADAAKQAGQKIDGPVSTPPCVGTRVVRDPTCDRIAAQPLSQSEPAPAAAPAPAPTPRPVTAVASVPADALRWSSWRFVENGESVQLRTALVRVSGSVHTVRFQFRAAPDEGGPSCYPGRCTGYNLSIAFYRDRAAAMSDRGKAHYVEYHYFIPRELPGHVFQLPEDIDIDLAAHSTSQFTMAWDTGLNTIVAPLVPGGRALPSPTWFGCVTLAAPPGQGIPHYKCLSYFNNFQPRTVSR